MAEPIIRVRGLTRRFGDFTAVDNLDLSVMPGSIYAFLGANGSGKSTTIRMLIGLLTPTAGEVEVDGVDVLRHPRRVRDRIGYMGQRVSLYQGLTLQENVQFYGGLYNLEGRALTERWTHVGERFDLLQSGEEKVEDLPAGVRQRAGLAVAMLHRPRILFLDEPTAGVDIRNRGLFWEIIQDEAESGVTVFVTTHFLEEAEFCDWVSFIDRGRLVANDEPERLRATFAEGYRVRVEVESSRRPEAAPVIDRSGLAFTATESGWTAVAPVLITPALEALEQLALVTGASVAIEQPEMTDVFRRVLEDAGAAR
jgi:ABC-2 type transport system ATP-binding protein